MKDKLNIKKLGLSLGIVVALGMFAGGLISMAGYGTEIINFRYKSRIKHTSLNRHNSNSIPTIGSKFT